MIRILVTNKGVYKCTTNMITKTNKTTYINNGNGWEEIGQVAHAINLDISTNIEEVEYVMEKLKQ